MKKFKAKGCEKDKIYQWMEWGILFSQQLCILEPFDRVFGCRLWTWLNVFASIRKMMIQWVLSICWLYARQLWMAQAWPILQVDGRNVSSLDEWLLYDGQCMCQQKENVPKGKVPEVAQFRTQRRCIPWNMGMPKSHDDPESFHEIASYVFVSDTTM